MLLLQHFLLQYFLVLYAHPPLLQPICPHLPIPLPTDSKVGPAFLLLKLPEKEMGTEPEIEVESVPEKEMVSMPENEMGSLQRLQMRD